jgi:hypothetical protein
VLDGDAHTGELYAGYAVGFGKLLVGRELIMRTRLMVEGTAGAARTETVDGVTGSLGAALRLQPSTVTWLELELGARQSWLPGGLAFAARGTAPVASRMHALEVGVAVTILLGRQRRECVFR